GAEQGIITKSQEQSLLALHQDRLKSTTWNATNWILVFGGLFIAGGISLIIASNWHAIGDITRICGFLLIYIIAGEVAIRLNAKSSIASIAFELIWMAMPFVG